MAKYQAEEGQEDRHGEMTGAITVNTVLLFPVLIAWCVFIGPIIFGHRSWWTVGIGLGLAIAGPILLLRPSRRIWASLSEAFDRV